MNTLLCDTPSKSLRSPAPEPMEVRRMDPLQDPEWDRLIDLHGGAGIFHRIAWARVLQRTYGHQPFYLAFRHEGQLAALVPLMEVRSILTGRRGVSVPFADFCGPLYFEGCDRGVVIAALSRLAQEQRWHHLEMRGGDPPEASAAPSVSYYAHSLDLTPGPDRLLEKCESSFRRAIRKAGRNGLTTEVRSDKAGVLAFRELHGRTRRRHGLPPQPLPFFLHIWEEIINKGMGSVVLASQGGVPMAASVFLYSGNKAIYKFGASDERFLDIRANNLVMWTGIRFLAEAGFSSLHLGRTSRGQDGLRRFKLGWGTAETLLNYYRFDTQSATWTTGRDRASGIHTALFSRLPLALNRLAGRILYPHLD